MNHFISLDKLAALEAMKGAFLSNVQTDNLTIAYLLYSVQIKFSVN